MRQLLKWSGLLIAWAAVSLAIAHRWVSRPDSMPPIPAPIRDWSLARYRPRGGEEIRDLEFLIALTAAAIGTAALFLLLRWGSRALQRRRAMS